MKHKTKVTRSIGITLITALLAISLFGVLTSVFSQHEHGSMINCPAMENTEMLCPIGTFSYVKRWLSVFTFLPVKNFTAVLMLCLAFLIIAGLKNLLYMAHGASIIYRREHPEIKMFSYLEFLFSQGIVHPKLYT